MAPLNLEIYDTKGRNWIKAGELNPGDPPGSISDNKPSGSRDVYIFECLSDLKSVVYLSKSGLDVESGLARVVVTQDLEVVAELIRGNGSYEMTVKTDKSSRPRKIRFTHTQNETTKSN